MNNRHEIQQPDSLNWEKSEVKELEIIEENVNRNLWNIFDWETEKFLISSVVNKIIKLNSDVEIAYAKGVLFCDNPENLKLPKWFYFSELNWITNKHADKSWIFVSINAYPIRYHPNFN